MADITTSIVVQFSTNGSGSGGGSLSAQLDDRPTGLNGGTTGFKPGDSPAFLVFKSSDVILDSVVASAGGVVNAGAGSYTVEETITFANSDTASLSKPFASGGLVTWYGNNLGGLTFSGNSVRASTKGVAVAKVSYQANYVAYRLNSPSVLGGSTNFSIIVVVVGHSA